MHKFLFLMACTLMGATLTIAADNNVYSCSRVDDADDWHITINLKKGTASLFDNDTDSLFTLIGIREIFPPVYVFVEKHQPNNLIEFRPSFDKKSGKATYRNKKEPLSKAIAFHCSVENK